MIEQEGYVAVTARLLASGEPAGDEEAGNVSGLRAAGPPQQELSGRDGTLLAVVPVPGTATSLVIVGYVVAAADVRSASDPGADTGLVVDRMQRRAWVAGQEIDLTFQEFELLAFLSEHPGTVFSRADLGTLVWQGALGDGSRTVDVHISRLRRKLGPAYGHYIATEYRAGYRFQAPGAMVTRGLSWPP